MRIKTFYAKSMAEALQEIKSTLGPDALLLSTKEISRRSGVWGRTPGFEVVAAVDNRDDLDKYMPVTPHGDEDEALPTRNSAASGKCRGDTISGVYTPASLVKGISTLSQKPVEASSKDKSSFLDSGEEKVGQPFKGVISHGLYRELVDCGVEDSLARTLLLNALSTIPERQQRSRATLLHSLTQTIRERICLPHDPNGMPEKRVVAFLGPAGAGKTTALAKLAAHLAVRRKAKVILMTLDGTRIGGVDQLRCYAGLMGVPFRFVEDISALPRAISENSRRDYILIDTAGYGPRDMSMMQGLAAYFSNAENIEKHLVLSASTKAPDMRSIMDRFEICRPSHLLFTRLDETTTPGPILNELVRTRKCFSYYTDGVRVPDDLHTAPSDDLMNFILNGTTTQQARNEL